MAEFKEKVIKFVAKALVAILSVFPFLSPLSPENNVKIKINPLCVQQEFDGFGTSAAWWSQMISDEEDRKDLAKELYSEDGLGLSIYRYNIGGGVNPEHDRVGEESRNTESFYYFNEKTGKYEYDFTRDANAQALLFEALNQEKSTVDTVILFANSPHYSMTISGEASGNLEQGKTNLSPDMYDDFVDYMLTITEHFISKGVPVKYISPINEPQWDWSGDLVGQEGCHYDNEQVLEILALFSKAVDERDLDVKISGPESGQLGEGWSQELREETMYWFDAITSDRETYKNVTSLSYHSYWHDNFISPKKALGDLVESGKYDGLKIEMSEWCELPCETPVDDVKAAVKMARVMANDINFSNVNSWTSWVAVNLTGTGEDGKLYSDGMFYANGDFSEYSKTTRYNAMAHFSKFVPAGSVVLKAKGDELSALYNDVWSDWWDYYHECNFAAFRTPEGKIVIVVTNEGHDRTITVPTLSLKMEVYTTDSEHDFEKTYCGINKGIVSVKADSINTIVLG